MRVVQSNPIREICLGMQFNPDDFEDDQFTLEDAEEFDPESYVEFRERVVSWVKNLDPGETFTHEDICEEMWPSQDQEYRWLNRRLDEWCNRYTPPVLTLEDGIYTRLELSYLLYDNQYILLRWAVWMGIPFTMPQAVAMLGMSKGVIESAMKRLNKRTAPFPVFIESPGNPKKQNHLAPFYWEVSKKFGGSTINAQQHLVVPSQGYIEPQKAMCHSCIGRSPREGGLPLSRERLDEIDRYSMQGRQHVCHNSGFPNLRACRHASDLMNRSLCAMRIVDAPTDEAVREFSQQIWMEEQFDLNEYRELKR